VSRFKKVIDRWTGAIVRPIARQRTEFLWRERASALRTELERRALMSAADFVMEKMPGALFCADKLEHLSFAFAQAPQGLALEFGVYKGTTVNHLAKQDPKRRFFGFDSFRGLPEDWAGSRYSSVNFDRRGAKPAVQSNVTLIEGWFDDTLPKFLAREGGPIGFLHIDCDIYSSTKTVLDLAAPRLAPGAVIVFDEFFNYKGYEQHEFKAFFEFVERFPAAYRYIGYSGQQVSVVIDSMRAPFR